jgi:hypothetical protein
LGSDLEVLAGRSGQEASMNLASFVRIAAIALTAVGFQMPTSQAADLLGPEPPAARAYGYGYAPEAAEEPATLPPASIYGAPQYALPGVQAYEPRVYATPVPSYAPVRECYWTQGDWFWNGYAWARRPVQVCN